MQEIHLWNIIQLSKLIVKKQSSGVWKWSISVFSFWQPSVITVTKKFIYRVKDFF